MRIKAPVVAALLLGTALGGRAIAGTLTASELTIDQQILNQFNLVNFGAYFANNESEGPIVVGGNFIANGTHPAGFNGGGGSPVVAGQTYGEVNVFGSVTGGFTPTGNSFILGSASGLFQNLNGATFNVAGSSAGATISGAGQINTAQSSFQGTAQNTASANIHTGLAQSAVFPFGSTVQTNFQTPLSDLSKALGLLPNLAGVTAQALPSNTQNLSLVANTDYTASGKTYGVITTTLANLASEQNFVGINNGSNDATIVVVTGNSNAALPALNGGDDESRVIWDFVDATSINFGGQWFGTVLAPNATVTDPFNLTGPVVVNSLTQNGELHWTSGHPNGVSTYGFGGNLSGLTGLSTGTGTATAVPEPTSLGLVGAALVGLGVLRRRSRPAP